jgi:hypothetical protein
MRRFIPAFLAFVSIVGLLSAQAETADAPETRPKNKAEIVAEKVEKQVEKIRGVKLTAPVKIGVYDKATLKAFLLKSADKELAPAKVDATVRSLRALELVPEGFDYKKVLLDVMNEQIAGFYDPETKELKLIDRSIPDPSESKGSSGGVDPLTAGMMKMLGVDMDAIIMAHELTHAIQDQIVSLKSLPIESEDDDDLATASKSLVEGDATLAMMAWMMGKGRPVKSLFSRSTAAMLDHLGDLASVPGADAVSHAPEYIQQELIFPYVAGLKFCIALDSADQDNPGFAATDRALHNPPLSTEQIIHPEKYFGEHPDYPIAVTLPDLGPTLGMTRLMTNTMGELGTRVILGGRLPKADAAADAEGWGGDRYALYGAKGSRDALVWLSTWDTDADADRFEAALKTWLGKVDATGKTSEESDVTSARYVAADGTLDAIARKGKDVMLVRGIPKAKLVPVLQKLFEETKKAERRKV